MNAEKAKEISSSTNWAEVCGELDMWIRAEESKFRYCASDDLKEIQATINLLEKVKNLPQIVVDREG